MSVSYLSAADEIELHEWRAGKRRIFWRVRKPGSVADFRTKADAFAYWRGGFAWRSATAPESTALGVTRVHVRPKGAK